MIPTGTEHASSCHDIAAWGGDRKDQAGTEQRDSKRRCHRGRCRNGNEAAGLPFEEQKLDRQEDRRERSGKDRRHTGGRSGPQQGLSLRR